MLTFGIIITVTAILMIVFPVTFMKLKSPGMSKKVVNSPRTKKLVRIWGVMSGLIGISMIVFAMI
jgi:hypothetical protein